MFKKLANCIDSIWYCKFCIQSEFPFGSLGEITFKENVSNDKNKTLKNHLQDYINKNNLNKQCTICYKTATRNSIPCSICQNLLHQKCCLVDLKNFSTLRMIKNWSCQKCIHDALPFQNVSNNELKEHVITETPLLGHSHSTYSSGGGVSPKRTLFINNTLFPIQNADHMPNFLILPRYKKSETKMKYQKRDYKHFNEEKFLLDLADTRIANEIYVQIPTNEKYNIFHEHFTSILDKHAPMRYLTKSEVAFKIRPWLTTGILKSISKKTQYITKSL